ncbi:UDP-N-acetylmuramoyl-L-alanine--D-glutamate ligase [Flavobacterium sp. W21_SRS_FM6]|uniref:UDP-N-acetylmuramoyl-L-alanine--D-glutamate ligase n=1 Tax=Flavobacterium sp. W21_SRS_FM6 TaxID=3240268 RepID=UPI003F93BDA1
MASINLANKNIVVVGLGLTGLSCVQFLLAQGAKVTAMDSRSALQHALDIPVHLGEFDAEILSQADLIVLSPGVSLQTPAIQHAIALGVNVVGDIELFARFNTLPLIAITGSNGKSTVTHLVVEMCKASGLQVLMGGNIGVPALALLNTPADIVVLELSSFQLETMSSLKAVSATVLNICDDHLDRHGSVENYKNIKHRIYDNAEFVVASRDESATQPSNRAVNITFGLSASEHDFSWDNDTSSILYQGQHWLSSAECLLVGAHNMLNIQAASALSLLAGATMDGIKQGAKCFAGLPHRCQTVAIHDHVRWINDSKATNVGATLAAIEGLASTCAGKMILIAGGQGKGADFSPLGLVLNEKIDFLITLGQDGGHIAALKAGSCQVTSLEEAVSVAAQHAQKNDIVLLSPACASLDMFNNYQHRGDCFAQAVQQVVMQECTV